MLTKDMKKTLDLLNTNAPDLQLRFFTISFISDMCNFDDEKALAVCLSLANEQYIVFADDEQSCIRLLEKGINYRYLEHKEMLNHWIPLVISYLLSIIALIISLINLIKY